MTEDKIFLIGNYINELMEHKNLTQTIIARETGVTDGYISKLIYNKLHASSALISISYKGLFSKNQKLLSYVLLYRI